MSTPPTAAGSGPPRRGWHALFGVAILLAIVMLVMVAVRAESSTDFRDFWENALRFRETGEIAHDEGVHNYLPFFTIFMTPWGNAAIVRQSFFCSAFFMTCPSDVPGISTRTTERSFSTVANSTFTVALNFAMTFAAFSALFVGI